MDRKLAIFWPICIVMYSYWNFIAFIGVFSREQTYGPLRLREQLKMRMKNPVIANPQGSFIRGWRVHGLYSEVSLRHWKRQRGWIFKCFSCSCYNDVINILFFFCYSRRRRPGTVRRPPGHFNLRCLSETFRPLWYRSVYPAQSPDLQQGKLWTVLRQSGQRTGQRWWIATFRHYQY